MFRTPYNIDQQAHSLHYASHVKTWPEPEIATVQDESTDINIIAKRMLPPGMQYTNGLQPLLNTELFTDLEDYGDALRKIAAADKAFMALPPEVRVKFDNDAGKAQSILSAMSPEQLTKELESWQPQQVKPKTSSEAVQSPAQQTQQSQQSVNSSQQTAESQQGT